jgi:sugar phosphate isomerase/epimerase
MIRTSLFIGTPDMPELDYVHVFREKIGTNISRASRLGFDGVELLIGDPRALDLDEMEKALAAHNVELACINSGRMASQFGLTLVHEEEAVRKEAFSRLRQLIELCGRFRCALNIGLFRGGAVEGKPIAYSKQLLVETLSEACSHAESLGVTINLEPTNRFEINFIHTTDEGLEIAEKVDHPNLRLLLDLYHMYIEDDDIAESLHRAKDKVRHIHFSDSDRLPPGLSHGKIDFAAIIEILGAIGYSGFLSVGLARTDHPESDARNTAEYLKGLLGGR